jgi:2',3'-cyclic-nucleotide 2'-phosphodiesterase (5'-nucleotidase family)
VIVLLADLEIWEIRELAEAALDVRVILGGRHLQCQELKWVGQTAVVAVGGYGRYVGKLTLEVDPWGRVVGAANQIRVLGQAVPDDLDMVALRDTYRGANL